ncbi:regulator of chromosome condensation [Cydia splendana]|uniref:regulator of chromosome condensation n=1 Tax=Cydia splendana TaxID=1100963 RepID=UPI0028F48563
MPAARGVKRTASKTNSATSASVPKNKKKRAAFQLEIPSAPKKRGSVFTCGQGDVGQLGLGEDVIETTKFKYVSGLGDKIVDVCAGGMHTIALDSDGKVWTFGCNDEGALGRPTSGETEEGTAGAVKLPAKAVAISAGDSHSAALLEDGQVYAWGAFRDSHGSMGLVVRGREGKACREPVRIDIGEPAADVASGGDHLVILSTTGGVYTMGCGEQGQLGRLAQRSASRDSRQGFSALLAPAKVTLKWAASHIWAGYHATFALDVAADKMFAWGLNNYGQLGITGEKRKTALYAPTECDAFTQGSGWQRVACGQHHSLALDSKGQVFAVGRCEYGRLGLGDRAGDAETLEPVPALVGKKCVSIAAGTCNSFAVTDTGEILGWGMGSEGQLGTGAATDAAAPTPAAAAFQARRPGKVAAGAQHTAILALDTSPVKEKSPTPEMETEEQPVEAKETKGKEKPKGRQNKKQKRGEQEDEVSSTSSAQPEVPEETKPQKVNGDEKKETPMEVDESDNSQDKKEDTQPDTEAVEPPKTEKTEAAPTEKASEPTPEPAPEKPEATKPELSDSSQDSQETDKPTDVEMKDEKVNGAPEEEKTEVEAKKVEAIPNDTVVATTA